MLGQRLLVAVIGIPLLLVALLAGEPWLALVVIALIVAAAIEMAGLLTRAGYPVRPAVAGAAALFTGGVMALSPVGRDYVFAGWLVIVIAGGLLSIWHTDPRHGAAELAGFAVVALATAALSSLVRILFTVRFGSAHGVLVNWLDDGRIWLLAIVLIVWAYDTAAYAVGRLFPRGRFFNHISVGKTASGAIGGLVGAIAVGLLMGYVILRPGTGLALGLLVGLVAPIGDLAESMLKRAAGVKDSSTIIPGHGGILDRMDSFLTVAPAAWLLLIALNVAN
jgi:phosphatidate cytidylyltransferase